jgi:hypothetical protein
MNIIHRKRMSGAPILSAVELFDILISATVRARSCQRHEVRQNQEKFYAHRNNGN